MIKIDLTGKKFGRLIVIGKEAYVGKNLTWLCKCDCGKIRRIRGASLNDGSSRSCGCLRKDYMKRGVINKKSTAVCTICKKLFIHRLSRNPFTCGSKECKHRYAAKYRYKKRCGFNPSFNYRISRIVSHARRRSREKHIPCNINSRWVIMKCQEQNMKCAKTGVPFELERSSKRTPWTPSLDQIQPGKGYTKDNTQVVCQMYNLGKHIWTHKDVVKLAQYLIKKEKI